jgi:polygalacturonase
MKFRIRYYLCLIAITAILLPSHAHADVWSLKSVRSYGATGDGITNDTAAINSAIAANKVVYFPPGTYVYVGPMTLPTNANYRIYGDGPGVSTILFTGPNAGITATHTLITTLNVEGLTLMANSTNCGTAINASFAAAPNNAKVRSASVHNVQIVGTARDGTSGGYWTNGMHLYRAQNSVIDKVHIAGNKNVTLNGILWDSSPSDALSGAQMTNLEVKWCNTALAVSGHVEGLYVTGFEFISCGRSSQPAISLSTLGDPPIAGAAFHLVNGQVDAIGNGIVLNNMIFVKISNVYFRHTGSEATFGTMLSVNSVDDLVVADCTFYGVDPFPVVSDENGIFLTDAHNVRIGGNNFSHMQPNNGSCIVIWSNSSAVRITDNLFSNVRQKYNDMTSDPNDPYYCGNSPTNNCGSTP